MEAKPFASQQDPLFHRCWGFGSLQFRSRLSTAVPTRSPERVRGGQGAKLVLGEGSARPGPARTLSGLACTHT